MGAISFFLQPCTIWPEYYFNHFQPEHFSCPIAKKRGSETASLRDQDFYHTKSFP